MSDFRLKKGFERWLVGFVCATFLGVPVAKAGDLKLKDESLKSWDEYTQTVNAQMKARLASGAPFLWVDESEERSRRVRAGKILVVPAAEHIPRPVPSGLIHHWIGAAFFPNTKLEDVLGVVRDYDHYQEFYKPSVVDSKSLAVPGEDDKFSMRLVNKEVVAKTALDSEYQACFQKLDATRWYSIAYTTRIQEIKDYGHEAEKKLPPDEGSGYIWRLYSIVRFEERDGGVYMEIEALALSRDIPVAFRWMADPIVRRVSKNALVLSLHQTQEAVHSVGGGAKLLAPTASSSCASVVTATK